MNIANRIQTIKKRIRTYEHTFGREPDSVHLLAVSKGQSIAAIQNAYVAGIRDFAESYLQEAQTKIQALQDFAINWHFIGPIQSNKTPLIAQLFAWVHSVSRRKIIDILHQQRPKTMPPLNICLQINLDNEVQKSGVSEKDVFELVDAALQSPGLCLRGLMTIPKQRLTEQEQYECFFRLKRLLHAVNKEFNITMDTLSMGMSEDFKAAIHAGSTIVRIGRGLFGERS